ncbi:hypothetical protein ACFYSF_46825, partial [Streptomyces canus]|uniref:hypothetical protein n=1 Tax=Streptomyces canus TaxID=58343 RepID=UPI0036D05454
RTPAAAGGHPPPRPLRAVRGYRPVGARGAANGPSWRGVRPVVARGCGDRSVVVGEVVIGPSWRG